MKSVSMLLIGESHTSMDVHLVQARVIELIAKSGRPVLIGLEMFPYTQQPWLDGWSKGLLTEEGFLELAGWYEHWSYSWLYYRDIFNFTRDHRIPMYGINTPRLGIERQARRSFTNRIATLIPVPIIDAQTRRPNCVRASYADFIWGVPAQDHPAYPMLGTSTRAQDGRRRRQVIQVERASPAERAGIEAGDVILAIDDADVPDQQALNRLMAAKRWGDSARIVVQRGQQKRTVSVIFRRQSPSS
ncbi:MAG: ChaN family lipoprotein [Acidobacteria bacterium]|nr:ChaN family lipoprotein [Acidobacteriota bacterium]